MKQMMLEKLFIIKINMYVNIKCVLTEPRKGQALYEFSETVLKLFTFNKLIRNLNNLKTLCYYHKFFFGNESKIRLYLFLRGTGSNTRCYNFIIFFMNKLYIIIFNCYTKMYAESKILYLIVLK